MSAAQTPRSPVTFSNQSGVFTCGFPRSLKDSTAATVASGMAKTAPSRRAPAVGALAPVKEYTMENATAARVGCGRARCAPEAAKDSAAADKPEHSFGAPEECWPTLADCIEVAEKGPVRHAPAGGPRSDKSK